MEKRHLFENHFKDHCFYNFECCKSLKSMLILTQNLSNLFTLELFSGLFSCKGGPTFTQKYIHIGKYLSTYVVVKYNL
jgi:hypothetical protein